MDYSTFYKNYISHYWEDDRGLRVGQFFMNELATYNFELYKSVPPELDCFYDDTLFCYCRDWVGENWKDTVNTKTTEEPEMPITKPTSYDEIYTTAERETSKQWATALSNFINELGGDSPALWEWEGKTPTPEKVVEYLRENIKYLQQLAADEELEACVEWVSIQLNCTDQEYLVPYLRESLREYRRPKPTLKSQALKDFETVRKHSDLLPEILDTIENALKSLPDT